MRAINANRSPACFARHCFTRNSKSIHDTMKSQHSYSKCRDISVNFNSVAVCPSSRHGVNVWPGTYYVVTLLSTLTCFKTDVVEAILACVRAV